MIKYNGLKDFNNAQSICISIGLVLYMITYIFVFFPFDAGKVYSDSSYFETVVAIGLTIFGSGFICANISFLMIRFKNKIVISVVILLSILIQFFLLGYLILMIGAGAIADADYHFSRDGVDFCRRTLIVSIIIIVCLVAQFVYTVMPMIRHKQYNKIKNLEKDCTKKYIGTTLRIINILMGIVLLGINIIFFYYKEETYSNAMSVFEEMHFSYFWFRLLFEVLAVGLPFLLLFIVVVDRCIKSKRYILTAIIYGMSVVAISNAMYFLYCEMFDYMGINEYHIFEEYNMILLLLAGTYFLCGLWNKVIDYFIKKIFNQKDKVKL